VSVFCQRISVVWLLLTAVDRVMCLFLDGLSILMAVFQMQLSARHAKNITLRQPNLPVLNWGCQLPQIDMCDGWLAFQIKMACPVSLDSLLPPVNLL